MNAKKPDRWLAALTALALATLACSALGGGGGATETPPKPRVPTQTPKAAAPTAEAATAEAEATATRPPKPTKTPPPALPSSTPASGPGDVLYYTGFDDLTDWNTILALPISITSPSDSVHSPDIFFRFTNVPDEVPLSLMK